MDNDGLSLPVPEMRHRGSDSNLYSSSDLQQKILKVTEQLRVERMEQDGNMAEFLKLVNKADKQQVVRIRQVFQKKNQKNVQNINQLQKKLEQYYKRMKESENNNNGSSKNSSPKDASKDQTKDVSKEVPKDASSSGGHHCLDKLKLSAPIVLLTPPSFFNKPREFANLIRNKFGSADNISQLKTSLDDGGGRLLSGSATAVGQSKFYSDDEDKSSTGTSASADSNGNPAVHRHDQSTINMMLENLREIRESQIRLAENMEVLKANLSGDGFLTQRLEDERDRVEGLEEQLNDLVELHQHEMANLKHDLANIEEKVAYQANERARDLEEVLESCNSRLCKLEQQVQVVQVETEGVFCHKLLNKVISVLLAVVMLLLVCVSMVMRCVMASVRSRTHLLVTLFSAMLMALVWRSYDKLNTNTHIQTPGQRTGTEPGPKTWN